MWVLLLIFLAPSGTYGEATVLARFATQAACQDERNRIGFLMAEAYPLEHTFTIECRRPRWSI